MPGADNIDIAGAQDFPTMTIAGRTGLPPQGAADKMRELAHHFGALGRRMRRRRYRMAAGSSTSTARHFRRRSRRRWPRLVIARLAASRCRTALARCVSHRLTMRRLRGRRFWRGAIFSGASAYHDMKMGRGIGEWGRDTQHARLVIGFKILSFLSAEWLY